MRKRIYNIIKIGQRDDLPSRIFDVMLVITILLNVSVTFMLTFDVFEKYYGLFDVIEVVTMVIFCIEYMLRIITADFLYPDEKPWRARVHFLYSFDGIVDLLTILPLVPLSGFIVFRILRVVRIFHLFRINNQYDSFNIITLVMKDKWKPICSSVIIILIFMMASSLGIYSVEHAAQPEAFSNAFSGMWWSMSTLLTVGYGDIYPITTAGKLMGMGIAFLGVGLVAIPTGIISAGFVEQFSYRKEASKKLCDIKEIGEVLVLESDDICGRTVEQIMKSRTLTVLLVLRGELKLVPFSTLVINANDILVVESERITKAPERRNKDKKSSVKKH